MAGNQIVGSRQVDVAGRNQQFPRCVASGPVERIRGSKNLIRLPCRSLVCACERHGILGRDNYRIVYAARPRQKIAGAAMNYAFSLPRIRHSQPCSQISA